MAVVATGSLADRPIGRTLATVAQRRFSGELAVTSGGKPWSILWTDGYVVGATGTHPADSAVKVALGAGLVSSSKASEILSALARSGGRDDIDVVAEVGRLAPEHVVRLRRRVVANRAMRLFALEEGQLVLDDQASSAAPPDMVPIDPRVILYQGAMAHLTDARFKRDLASLGDAFQLRADARDALDAFGFGEPEREVIAALLAHALSPTALVQAAPTVDPRLTMAVVYALAMWGYAEPLGPRLSGQVAAAVPATPVEAAPARPAGELAVPTRTPRGTRAHPGRGKPTAVDAAAIRRLVAEKKQAIDQHADHFALLGVGPDAPPDQVRAAYFDVARQLHPDRITAIGLEDVRADAQRVFAQINAAFGVLSNPRRRADYAQVQAAGGEAAVRRREDDADELAERLLAAEEHFRLGEMALRRNQFAQAIAEARVAVEFNPEEGEHHALWGWATWCATIDKKTVSQDVRAALEKATRLSPKNPIGFLYLGKVARAEGLDDEAARWLREALKVAPGHAEAGAELRIVELHLGQDRRTKAPTQPPAPAAGPDDDKKKPGGLFGRFKR